MSKKVIKRVRRWPRYDTVALSFFRQGYSVSTIANHYKCDVEMIEDKIRKYMAVNK